MRTTMTRATIDAYNEALTRRLVASASRVMECPVEFVRYEKDRTGADVPVFRVPAEAYQRCVNAGLRIDNTPAA